MPRASHPHTPDDDLAAHRAYSATLNTPRVLTPELEAFCQSGVSVIVGVCRRGETPIAGLGCGCRLRPDGRMRLLLARAGNEALLAAVDAGARISVTFSQPVTHRSIQVKGSEAVVTAADDEDREEAVRQSQGVLRELVEVDYPAAFAEAYCRVNPQIIVGVDFTLDAAFVQTPGPGAGAEMTP
ncbi:conserved protein of unknown function [Pseudorhizobium banfieldiae]|uniref:Pyridoxamine 5'-phosphate oxidase putative domain-containing protein n=1 Tax=Pseudorhizobium banfieldiae TaxID=1125847 RepID=L0NBD3_9HYPH|nr:hypothetical protein [Pseudorhizobium banfieldiae]CAD6602183.1 pyridoxamine 5'-phosphate oxidase family protein [arsenite-oxidising bacterium NT-25]CAD6606630.1 pyridoxamine 5'-phosphate oxidase family protein [Rhizobium sp. TCK]CCF18385.1 conserved protein of unknown function [Pseudorhizobium banfieldiae]